MQRLSTKVLIKSVIGLTHLVTKLLVFVAVNFEEDYGRNLKYELTIPLNHIRLLEDAVPLLSSPLCCFGG